MELVAGNTEKIKNEIIKVATSLFLKNGYKKTSIKEISEKLNISRTPIYYHFKSKENLSKLCIDKLFEKYDRAIDKIIYSDKSIEEKFKDISNFIYANNKELYKIHVDLANEAPTNAYKFYIQHLNNQFNKLKDIIAIEKQLNPDFDCKKISVDGLIDLLFTIYYGLIFIPNNNNNTLHKNLYEDQIINSIISLI